jgi:hypothetical protein
MAKTEKLSGTKQHTVYKLSDGTRVPGVTTVLGVLDKGRALLVWANKIGLEGIQLNKYVDKLATVGTLAHYLVECELTDQIPELSSFSNEEIDKAENCLLSFYEWQKQHKIERKLNEQILVSEEYRYGGTCDFYCLLNGIETLIDFKTGSGIYQEYYWQVCAYRNLLIENGYPVKQVRILNIPRKETEEFQEKIYTKFDKGFEVFKHALAIYRLKKE